MTVDDILTPRLVLRSVREADADFCLSLWLDPEVGRYLSDPPRELADEAELTFASGIESDPAWYPFIAYLRETGEPVGTCSAVPMDAAQTHWDVGYCLRRDMWRQGYGTEMVRGLMDFARSRGARVFTATAAKDNAASCALLRSLGFHADEETAFAKRLTPIVYSAWRFRLDA